MRQRVSPIFSWLMESSLLHHLPVVTFAPAPRSRGRMLANFAVPAGIVWNRLDGVIAGTLVQGGAAVPSIFLQSEPRHLAHSRRCLLASDSEVP